MNRFGNYIALFALSLIILALPNFASAQYRNNRNDGYYGNNNGYSRNLQSTVKDLKNRSREFERRLDRDLDRSRYDGSNREDRILQIARDFQNAADNLDRSYDNRNDYNRSQDEARNVLQLGSQLQRAVSRARISSDLNNDWSRISQDLRTLADAYNYNYNNNGGYGRNNDGYYGNDDDYNRNNRNNRRGTNNNDWRRNFPFPLPF